MSKNLVINSCEDCPHVVISRDYTEDSWELVYMWGCELLKRNVRRYVDWNDKSKFIPEDCPLEE